MKTNSGKSNFGSRVYVRAVAVAAVVTIMVTLSNKLNADTGMCGGSSITLPFTDVPSSNVFFCSIAEAFFSGLTNGTSATTYSPSDPVTREQMAAFITRTQDSALRRGSKRAALRQFWMTTPQYAIGGTTLVGGQPQFVKSDGADLWVASFDNSSVSRVRASDGKLLETWTSAVSPVAVLVAMGRVFVTGTTNPGRLYMIDPKAAAGAVTLVTGALGSDPLGIAFDGSRIWTVNFFGGSVSIVTPASTTPWPVTNVTTGFAGPTGILFDGSNIWVTDYTANKLLKLDQNGAILQTITMAGVPNFPAFDGTNIWVPNHAGASVSVVRASTGSLIQTLTGNGLDNPLQAAFDGQRILVTNQTGSVSLWKAADLTPVGTFSTGANSVPLGACSDGVNFWITLSGGNELARF